MKHALLLVGNALLRCGGILFGVTTLLGYMRYPQYYGIADLVPGIVLLAFSLLPLNLTSRKPFFVAAAAIAVFVAYVVGGLPFMNPVHDTFARLMFVVEFALLIVFFIVSGVLLFRRRVRPSDADASNENS